MGDDEGSEHTTVVELPTSLPLFPLPNLVAFPGIVVPLHIFEPRYRALVQDLDDEHPFLGLAVLTPGGGGERAPQAEVNPIVCGGRVANIQPRDDGRFDIVFVSLARARLLEDTLTDREYRVGKVDWIEPHVRDEPNQLSLKLGLYQVLEQLAASHPNLGTKALELREHELPLGRLTDMVASSLPLHVHAQTRILEELDASKRAVLLLAMLRSVVGDLQAQGLN